MKATILAVVALAFSANQALATSHAVKMACAGDYFANCSMHAVGSPGVRKCMKAVGSRLSAGCMSALVSAGEVSKATHKKYLAKLNAPAKQLASKKKADKRYAKAETKKKYAKKPYERRINVSKEYAKRDVARG